MASDDKELSSNEKIFSSDDSKFSSENKEIWSDDKKFSSDEKSSFHQLTKNKIEGKERIERNKKKETFLLIVVTPLLVWYTTI